jgi:glycolate oxidase FAD binding subunit
LRAFQLATTQLSANATIERCPSDLRAEFDVFGPLPRSFDLMRRVKQQFDPNNVLSPGRFVGRL